MKKYISFMFLAALSLVVFMPLIMLFSGSLTGTDELSKNLGPIFSSSESFAKWPLFPDYPTLQPYVELLLDSPEFFKMFWNSVLLTAPSVAGQLLIATPAAWAFARYKFRFKKALFLMYIALMLMPFQVTMVSSYLVLDKFSLLDTRWAVILPAAFSTFPVFIMVKFFSSIPQSLIEAAALDGANEITIFIRIGVPLGLPGVISAAILGFLECWNAIEQPLTFLTSKQLWPLSLYLPSITIDGMGAALAASAVMLIPSLLVFLAGQKHLEQGIIAAGLKE